MALQKHLRGLRARKSVSDKAEMVKQQRRSLVVGDGGAEERRAREKGAMALCAALLTLTLTLTLALTPALTLTLTPTPTLTPTRAGGASSQSSTRCARRRYARRCGMIRRSRRR